MASTGMANSMAVVTNLTAVLPDTGGQALVEFVYVPTTHLPRTTGTPPPIPGGLRAQRPRWADEEDDFEGDRGGTDADTFPQVKALADTGGTGIWHHALHEPSVMPGSPGRPARDPPSVTRLYSTWSTSTQERLLDSPSGTSSQDEPIPNVTGLSDTGCTNTFSYHQVDDV